MDGYLSDALYSQHELYGVTSEPIGSQTVAGVQGWNELERSLVE